MPTFVLGRELPADLDALYQDVVALRPEADLKFQAVAPAGARLPAWHEPDSAGSNEVRIVEGFDMATVAHQLLHLLHYRRGYPVTTTVIGADRVCLGPGHRLRCQPPGALRRGPSLATSTPPTGTCP